MIAHQDVPRYEGAVGVEDCKPEFTGKMSFYLTAVDELERQPDAPEENV